MLLTLPVAPATLICLAACIAVNDTTNIKFTCCFQYTVFAIFTKELSFLLNDNVFYNEVV